jgi:transmembrane sensor
VRALLDALVSFEGVQTRTASDFDELAAVPEVCSRRSFTQPVLGGLVLASVCVAALALVLTQLSALSGTAEHAGNPVCTGIGEVRNLSLDDGSRIELTTRTCVEVLVSQTKREVHLLQGEALFTVRHDDRKPFTVLTPHVCR